MTAGECYFLIERDTLKDIKLTFANFSLGHFAGINFPELGFTKDFAGLNFRERNLYKKKFLRE